PYVQKLPPPCPILVYHFTFAVKMTNPLQNFFMNVFFCSTGFTCSIAIIKKSGKQGAILAIGAVLFLFVQNTVGVALAGLFHINKLLGIAMGSISMSGGVGSGAAFGPTLEALGADGGTTVGVAAATFGLLMGSLVGGPVAERLIKKYNLKSSFVDEREEGAGKEIVQTISDKHFFISVLEVLGATAVGSYIYLILTKLTGLTFPYYVGCLFGGMLFRNLADHFQWNLNMKEVDLVGNCSLNLFLSLALMNLNIAKLITLAGPMVVILLVQAVVMAFWATCVTFKSMGSDYDAAVMAAGHCGVGLGQTPNAVANMQAIIEAKGPAPKAWFILPVITVVFINLCNPLVITLFINLFK
ncbi:MAG: sodium/glutamate symporter, partial [Acidaminococcus sp.]|uniref:sodium/glutamate symporter n=1 Tax=Acidaminococcus sp. TaxID=1872103 RepID=UPI0026DEFD0E